MKLNKASKISVLFSILVSMANIAHADGGLRFLEKSLESKKLVQTDSPVSEGCNKSEKTVNRKNYFQSR